jgi:REP element-mobilizing transposase RayT
MPFWRTYYHLVWATHERLPLIQPNVEKRLYAYTVAKSAEIGVYVYAINGWHDHLHLVAAIPPKISISEVVKTLKGSSSHDLNQSDAFNGNFGWQRGYGVFSLGEKQKSIAEKYVNEQKQHHQSQTINEWLERCNEEDEGPHETGLSMEHVPPILREQRARYMELGETPF